MASWMSHLWIKKMQPKYNLKPYWPEEISNDESFERKNNFEKEIYPIWGAIEQKYWESDKPEREIVHMCDLAIVASGKYPDRSYYNMGDIDRLRKKSVAGKDFRKWKVGQDEA